MGDICEEIDPRLCEFLLIVEKLAVDGIANHHIYYPCNQQYIEQFCPPCQEGRRRYGKLQGRDIVSPHAIAVRGFDLKTIAPRSQVEEMDFSLARWYIRPCIRDADHPVGKVIVLAIMIAVRSEAYAYIRLLVREFYRFILSGEQVGRRATAIVDLQVHEKHSGFMLTVT